MTWNKTWNQAYQLKLINYWAFLSEHNMKALDVGIGDDVFWVGRFIGHGGTKVNLPVVRFGNIAMMPLEPMHVRGEGQQNAFLIESRIIQGFSGSPVFLSIPPWELREYPPQTVRKMLYKDRPVSAYSLIFPESIPYFIRLLGITIAFIEDDLNSKIGKTGMMAAVPAWELLELLNYRELQEQRRAEVEYWKSIGEFNGATATPA